MGYAQDQAEVMQMADQTTVESINLAQAERYVSHIKEEARELQVAWDHIDMVKAIDGATDIIVVALGFMLSIGINPDDAWNAVLRANRRKLDGSCGEKVKRPDGQFGKPSGWWGPEGELREIWMSRRNGTVPLLQVLREDNGGSQDINTDAGLCAAENAQRSGQDNAGGHREEVRN